MDQSASRYLGLATAVVITAVSCGGSTSAPTRVSTLSGTWLLFSVTTNSCSSSLPPGFGVGPRGGGSATIVQNGNDFDGQLFIFNRPAGTIHGTIAAGNIVSAQLNLDGQNVGPASPCRVVGSGTGTTDGRCFITMNASANFACPDACNPADVVVMLRAHAGLDDCPR